MIFKAPGIRTPSPHGFAFALACALVLMFSGSAVAAPKSKKRSLAVACPKVIANKSDGTQRSTGSSSQYKCFRNSVDARRDGFFSTTTARAYDFTGWYRLTLTLTSSTCGDSIIGGPTLFLEVKQNSSGVFGQLCPSVGTFSGTRNASRLTVSGIANYSENPAQSLCDDGQVQRHQYLEMSRVVDGDTAFSVLYTQIFSCPSAGSYSSCSRKYTGIGRHETHQIWPIVSDDLHQLASGCSAALNTCVDCHPELAGLGQH